MARVKVKTFTVIRDVLGAGTVEIEGEDLSSVKDVLDSLLERYGEPLKRVIVDPETGRMAPFLIRLNDEIISNTIDIDKHINNGDELTLIFPIGGG